MSINILIKIRALMKNVPLKALIVTNHDSHMSEYLAEQDKRLSYISGFTGSAGTAIITEDAALMWTDGRYFIQASKEMDSNWGLMKVGIHGTPTEGAWLSSKLPSGSVVGTDSRLMPYTTWLNLEKELQQAGITLVPLPFNFVDNIWVDRPDLKTQPIEIHDVKYAGDKASWKIEKTRKAMLEKGADTLILTALDDIAWLLNLRGSDIPYNPVFFSYLILDLEHIRLFVDENQVTAAVTDHLKNDNLKVLFHPYDNFYSTVNEMTVSMDTSKKVWICRSANYHIYSTFPESKRVCECSPVAVLKALKNEVEVKGMINAHIKDGVALCRFFSWLEVAIDNTPPLTEIAAANILEDFRKQEEDYVGPSFPTISSSGPHAAIIHYIPDNESDRVLKRDEIYLCDSGAQYLDGTTDVTRTVHLGNPTDFQKECFTRVFQGVVSLATAVFPYGIKGNCLDSLARKALWDVGLDYKHGTGHGIGSYLFVHEGPMGISWRPCPDDPGLRPNMFLSDEPGYYHEGEFGIRIENIIQIIPSKTNYNMNLSEKGFLTFNTITLCPIQTKMFNVSLLTVKEVNYINEYHQLVRDTLGPILQSRGYLDAYHWLKRETDEIKIR